VSEGKDKVRKVFEVRTVLFTHGLENYNLKEIDNLKISDVIKKLLKRYPNITWRNVYEILNLEWVHFKSKEIKKFSNTKH